jgi:dolichol-phosphate mannosyltransferase
MQHSQSLVGVVIPSYLEGENIQTLIRQISEQLPEKCRIVVVDDSPTDQTVKLVKQMQLPHVDLVHRSGKGGRGSAVLEGMAHLLKAGCETIVEMDADLSHPPAQIPSLIALLNSRQSDMLIASRYLPSSEIRNWPLTRRIFSKCSNLLAKAVLRVPISDYTNGYRVYSRAGAQTAVGTCGQLGKGFIALSEILVNLYFRNYKVSETPTVFVNRVRGESSVTYKEVLGALVGLYRIFWLKRELSKPCHIGKLSFEKNGNAVP